MVWPHAFSGHSTPTSLSSVCTLEPLTGQFSRSVMSDSLRPHELQHARPPCPSPTPEAYPNSCPLSQWCHPTISSSVVPFSSCLQSFPTSGSFQMSQFFTSGGQNIRVSASTSVLPINRSSPFHSISGLYHKLFSVPADPQLHWRCLPWSAIQT